MAHPPEPRGRLFLSRLWIGIGLAAAGIGLLWLGWYLAAGETMVAAQLPYLASASLPGAALLAAGAVVVSGEFAGREDRPGWEMVASLYDLLTEPAGAAAAGRSPGEEASAPVAVPGGTSYHLPGCVLVESKPGVHPVDGAEVGRLGLVPCPVCTPPPPG